MVTADSCEVITKVFTGGAQLAYLEIPSSSLRTIVDGLFSTLAKNSSADAVSGYYHRWIHGHDLLLDVTPGMFKDPIGALHQAGHIILTDFPTKMGIPIPGFSESGIGSYLVELGIPKGYLSLNMMDAGVGIFAISEGSLDLLSAISGDLSMNAWTAFDTFGEGILEIIIGCNCIPVLPLQNPLLIISGLENIAAGSVSLIRECVDYVDPGKFFGYSMTGALLGMSLSYFFNRKTDATNITKNILSTGFRSAMLSGLSSASSYFTAGAFLGLLIYELGKKVSKNSLRQSMSLNSCNSESFQAFLKSCTERDPDFERIWKHGNILPPSFSDFFKCSVFKEMDSSEMYEELKKWENNEIELFNEILNTSRTIRFVSN